MGLDGSPGGVKYTVLIIGKNVESRVVVDCCGYKICYTFKTGVGMGQVSSVTIFKC